MTTDPVVLYPTHPDEARLLDTDQLRRRFVLDDLFRPGAITLAQSQADRMVIGGAVPNGGTVDLTAPDFMRSDYFCERREVGVVCLNGSGMITCDGTEYPIAAHEILYIGKGTKAVSFSGEARFYLVSAIAHRTDPTTLSRQADAETIELGTTVEGNLRTLRKHIHLDGVRSNALAMGITTIHEGSVWNTMPCHLHERRTEVYLYFDLPGSIMHLMGEPQQTRHVMLRDGDVVVSPPWSVHAGAGTSNYSFVWCTAGENQTYTDAEVQDTAELR